MNKRGAVEIFLIMVLMGFIAGSVISAIFWASKQTVIDGKVYIRVIKTTSGFGWYELGNKVELKQVAEVIK